MSNDVTTWGGGPVTLPAGGIVPARDTGDLSVDRGGDPRTVGQILHGDIQRAVGVALSKDQIRRAQDVLQRFRLVQDEREKVACYAALKGRWGAATEGNLVKVHGWLLDTLGKKLADAVLGARESDGTALCNKPELLEAMLKEAHGTRDGSDGNDGSAPDQRQREIEVARGAADRLRELDGWMSNRDPRYWKDEAVQREYRDLLDRGVTADVTPNTADSGVERRIKEIEAFMGARPGSADFKRYWDSPQMQEEYRELQRRRK